jgi:cysteine desulfurase
VAYALKDRGNHIITSKVEHLSVLGVCKALEEEGFRVTYIDVDTYGMVKPEEILAAIEPSTILISITYANNEVGTIQPIKEISQIAQDKGIYLHTDAVQAFGNLKFKVEDLGVDLLSLSSHKIYGPKGAGALYVKKGTRIVSILHGGGHEKRLRPGTENVPGIVGFGKAAEIAANKVEENKNYLTKLRDQLYNGVVERIEDVSLNGHPTWRLPNILNISFGGVEGELLMLNLELKGIICSAGSAYTLNSSQPSHVLTAMGVPKDKAWEAIRFSLGRNNTEEEVNYTIDVLEEVISQLRSISEVYKRN